MTLVMRSRITLKKKSLAAKTAKPCMYWCARDESNIRHAV